MPRPRRYFPAQLTHHIVQRGHNRCEVFRDDWDRHAFLLLLGEAAAEHHVAIHTYVLMDNHVHLVATPATADGVPLMMQAVGRSYVPGFNRRHARTGGLWGGRYRSFAIETERYLLTCLRYVDVNPVRAGMVEDPRDYAWSGYHATAFGRENPIITPHPFLDEWQPDPVIRREQYRAFCGLALPDGELAALRKAARGGLALGSPQFVCSLRGRSAVDAAARC
jgi:putative transposase